MIGKTMIGKMVIPCVLAVVSTCQVLAQEAKPNPLECDEFGSIRQGRYLFFGGDAFCDNELVFSGMNLFCMLPGNKLSYPRVGHSVSLIHDRRDRNGEDVEAWFWRGHFQKPYPVRYIQKTRIEGNRIRRDVGHQGKWDPVPTTYQYDIILQKSSFGAITECLVDGKLVKLPAEPGEELLAGNVKKIQINPKDPERNFTFECDRGMNIQDKRKTWPQGTFKIEIPLKPEAEQEMVTLYVTLPDAARTGFPKPAIRRSQVGYPVKGQKYVMLEYAPNVDRPNDDTVKLERRGMDTNTVVMTGRWGESFRYRAYQLAKFDFSAVTQTGDYRVVWSGGATDWFPIKESMVRDDMWTLSLDYFLPWEMCHAELFMGPESPIRHRERCHPDETIERQPPPGVKPEKVYTVKTGKEWYKDLGPEYGVVTKRPKGGWHDCGDYLKRMNMLAGIVCSLSSTWEEFGLDRDNNTLDVDKQVFRYGEPDGTPDVVQQVEWGVLFIADMVEDDGYVTGGFYGSKPYGTKEFAPHGGGMPWVHQVNGMLALLNGSRALKQHRPKLAALALERAKMALAYLEKAPYPPKVPEGSPFYWDNSPGGTMELDGSLVSLYGEFYLTTGDKKYLRKLLDNPQWLSNLDPYRHKGSQFWVPYQTMGRLFQKLPDAKYREYRALIRQTCLAFALAQGNGTRASDFENSGGPIVTTYWLNKVVPDVVSMQDALPIAYSMFGLHPGSDMVWLTGLEGTPCSTSLFSGWFGILPNISEEWIAKWRVKNPNAFFIPGAVVPGPGTSSDAIRGGAPLTYIDHWSYWTYNEASSWGGAAQIEAMQCLKKAGF